MDIKLFPAIVLFNCITINLKFQSLPLAILLNHKIALKYYSLSEL